MRNTSTGAMRALDPGNNATALANTNDSNIRAGIEHASHRRVPALICAVGEKKETFLVAAISLISHHDSQRPSSQPRRFTVRG